MQGAGTAVRCVKFAACTSVERQRMRVLAGEIQRVAGFAGRPSSHRQCRIGSSHSCWGEHPTDGKPFERPVATSDPLAPRARNYPSGRLVHIALCLTAISWRTGKSRIERHAMLSWRWPGKPKRSGRDPGCLVTACEPLIRSLAPRDPDNCRVPAAAITRQAHLTVAKNPDEFGPNGSPSFVSAVSMPMLSCSTVTPLIKHPFLAP